jgi:hypothetical protein
MNEPLLTPKEVGTALRQSYHTVLDYIKSGELEAVDMSRAGSKRPSYRVRPAALTRMVEMKKVVVVDAGPRGTQNLPPKARSNAYYADAA